MKKLVISIILVIIGMVIFFIGGNYFVNEARPTLNGNEKIISKSLNKDGKPEDVIGSIPENSDIPKNLNEAYVSVKVNHKDFKEGRVTLEYDKKVIDDVVIKVSKDGYISYHVKDISNMNTGLYQLSFYDENDKVNVYAAFEVVE